MESQNIRVRQTSCIAPQQPLHNLQMKDVSQVYDGGYTAPCLCLILQVIETLFQSAEVFFSCHLIEMWNKLHCNLVGRLLECEVKYYQIH